MKPEISIIIPVYNSSKYIKSCLDSILNQTFKNFEVIIIDDGSTDNSYDILKEYSTKNTSIKLFKNSNHGVSFTRNYGISLAQADYLCFIDSDDWIDENYLENFYNVIQLNPEIDYIVQGIKYDWGNDKTKELFSYKEIIIKETEIANSIVDYKLLHNGCPVAKLFKRSIIEKKKLRFNENICMHEDHIFVLDYFLEIKNIYLLSNTSYHYRRSMDDSLSKKIHKPENLFLASNLLFSKFDRIEKKFNLNNTKYKKDFLTHYGLSQRLRAIINLYKMGYENIERKNIIIQEKKCYNKIYKQWFACSTLSRFIYLKLFLHAPFFIFDKFNKILIKNKSI